MTRIATRIATGVTTGIITGAATGLGALLLPGAAAAHPDHASGGEFGLLHFATDPFHVGITAAAALVFVLARRLILRRKASAQTRRG